MQRKSSVNWASVINQDQTHSFFPSPLLLLVAYGWSLVSCLYICAPTPTWKEKAWNGDWWWWGGRRDSLRKVQAVVLKILLCQDQTHSFFPSPLLLLVAYGWSLVSCLYICAPIFPILYMSTTFHAWKTKPMSGLEKKASQNAGRFAELPEKAP